MDNKDQKKKRAAKTTRRQYELYLEELRANKAFRENKFDATQPNIIEESWQKLCEKLNASGGPVKSTQEWKRVFTYWKSQVKSKARELKIAQRETGNKDNKMKLLTDLENNLLDIIGRVVVDGMNNVAQFGIVDSQFTQPKGSIQEEKSIENEHKSIVIVNPKLPELDNASTSAINIDDSNHSFSIEMIDNEDVIEKSSKKITQKQASKRTYKTLTGCLQEFMNNNPKETSQYEVLCEIRNHVKNIEMYEAKRLKLEKLKVQLKYPNHIFVLSSDSE